MNQEINSEFLAQIEEFEPKFQASLAPFSTWKIGGPAQILIQSPNAQVLEKLIKLCLKYEVKYTILGHASNVLISDAGISGLVIINKSKNISMQEKEAEKAESEISKEEIDSLLAKFA